MEALSACCIRLKHHEACAYEQTISFAMGAAIGTLQRRRLRPPGSFSHTCASPCSVKARRPREVRIDSHQQARLSNLGMEPGLPGQLPVVVVARMQRHVRVPYNRQAALLKSINFKPE